MTRDAFQAAGGFDRVGILLYDKRADLLWDRSGVDHQGQPYDLAGDVRAAAKTCHHPAYAVVGEGSESPLIADASALLAVPTDDPLHGSQECLIAAIRLADELIGVLWADNLLTRRALTGDDLALLEAGVPRIAVALLAARVRTLRERHQDIARRLTRLGEIIVSEAELDQVLRLIRDAVIEVGRLDRVGIYLRDPGSGKFKGVWGTGRDGQPQSLHDSELQVTDRPDDPIGQVLVGQMPYALETNHTERYGLSPDDPMFGVKHHCVLPMRVGSEIVGVLVGDNLLTDTPINEDDVAALLPFAEYAALAVHNSRLQRQLRERVSQLQHLGRIASAITANSELSDMMRLVRDGIVGSGLFDRAGVFIYDPGANTLTGTWGTDRQGNLEDISSNVQTVDPDRGMPSDLVVSGRIPYSLLENREALGAELTPPWMQGVRWHAVVPMRVGDQIVGCISVDNALSDRPISDDDIQLLLPFAEQAAAAVRAARMASELRQRVSSLEALGRVAAASAAQTDLRVMMRMVRNAIVDCGMFDRAGVWLYDHETRMITGTWGTDRQGRLEDLGERSLPLDDESPVPLHRVLRGEIEYSLIENRSALQPEHTPETMRGVRSHAVVPMRAGDVILGAIAVDNLLTNRLITDEDVRALFSFAEQSAVAVQKARLLAQLEEARHDLEQKVEARTAELVQMSEEMAAFMYTLSHDLKAPVRAAHGFTCAVMEQYGELLPAEGRRDLERVRMAARRMGALIEALVALGRLRRSELRRRRVVPTHLAHEAIRSLRADFPHAAAITVDDLPPCDADPGLLQLVFQNLIKNALQATAGATMAMIHIGYEDGAYFVRDNGVGFDQEYAHTLFDVFRRYRASDEIEGTGFSLAFVRRAVEMHGGRVWAEGSPGKGATFRFTIGEGTATRTASPLGVLTRSGPAARQSDT
ncbi:MAG: GAF domain-containing protein [Chthonomonadales bacterium]|nr:GAF domain-containing protein [Chthonomonadales bacterium]